MHNAKKGILTLTHAAILIIGYQADYLVIVLA